MTVDWKYISRKILKSGDELRERLAKNRYFCCSWQNLLNHGRPNMMVCDDVVVLITCTVCFERLMLANVVAIISWEANTQIPCYCEAVNDIEERRAPCFVSLVFFLIFLKL